MVLTRQNVSFLYEYHDVYCVIGSWLPENAYANALKPVQHNFECWTSGTNAHTHKHTHTVIIGQIHNESHRYVCVYNKTQLQNANKESCPKPT